MSTKIGIECPQDLEKIVVHITCINQKMKLEKRYYNAVTLYFFYIAERFTEGLPYGWVGYRNSFVHGGVRLLDGVTRYQCLSLCYVCNF